MESPIEKSHVPDSTESKHAISSPKVTDITVKPNARNVARLCSRPLPIDSISLPFMDKSEDEKSKMSSNERKVGKRKPIQLLSHHDRPQATTCSAGGKLNSTTGNKKHNSAIFPENRNSFITSSSVRGIHPNFTSTSSYFVQSTPSIGQHNTSNGHVSLQSRVSSSAICRPRSTVRKNSTKAKEKSDFKYTNRDLVPSDILALAQNDCTLKDKDVTQKHKIPPWNGSTKVKSQIRYALDRKQIAPKTKMRDAGTMTVFGSETFQSIFQEYVSTGRISNKRSRIPVRINTHKLPNNARRRYSDGTGRNIRNLYHVQSAIVKRVNDITNLSPEKNQYSKEIKQKVRIPPPIPNTRKESDSIHINTVERRACESRPKSERNQVGHLHVKGTASTTDIEPKNVDNTQEDAKDCENNKDDVAKVKSEEYNLHGMFECALQ